MSLMRRLRFWAKPVVTPQDVEDELTYLADQAISDTEKGQAGGIATLGADGKVPASQLPATVAAAGLTVSLSGNTSGALAAISSGTMILAGGNNITLSQNGQSVTISAGAGTAAGGIAAAISGNTSGTLSTITSGTALLFGGNNVTLSQNGQSITISGANTVAQSVQTQSRFNLTLSGNTAGVLAEVSSGTLTMHGGNNITLSQNGNAITVSGATIPAQSVESNTFGMSNLGNSAGTSGVVSGPQLQMLMAGGANITLSQSINGSSATVSIVGGAGGAAGTNTFGMSNLGNTAGTSGVVTGTGIQMLLAGGPNITLSQSINGSSATVSISAAGAGGGISNYFYAAAFEPYQRLTSGRVLSETLLAAKPIFFPLCIQQTSFVPNTLRLLISGAGATNKSLVHTMGVALYEITGSDGMTRLTSASTNRSFLSSSQYNGMCAYDFGLGGYTVTKAGVYVAGIYWSNGANNTGSADGRFMGADNVVGFGGVLGAGTASTGFWDVPFHGAYSVTTATSAMFPATVSRSELWGGNTQWVFSPQIILRQI